MTTWVLLVVAVGACGDNQPDPCLCTVQNPGLSVMVDWSDEGCGSADRQFGIRSENAILSASSARCLETDEQGRILSALLGWPGSWFGADALHDQGSPIHFPWCQHRPRSSRRVRREIPHTLKPRGAVDGG